VHFCKAFYAFCELPLPPENALNQGVFSVGQVMLLILQNCIAKLHLKIARVNIPVNSNTIPRFLKITFYQRSRTEKAFHRDRRGFLTISMMLLLIV
jgi:hypothetical protein